MPLISMLMPRGRTVLFLTAAAGVACGLTLRIAAAPPTNDPSVAPLATKVPATERPTVEATPAAAPATEAVQPGNNMLYRLPERVELTDRQRTEIGKIEDHFRPWFADYGVEFTELLTPEQREARNAAAEVATAAGLAPRQSALAAESAMKLTREQRAEVARIRADLARMRQEMRWQMLAVLTIEQRREWVETLQAEAARATAPQETAPEPASDDAVRSEVRTVSDESPAR